MALPILPLPSHSYASQTYHPDSCPSIPSPAMPSPIEMTDLGPNYDEVEGRHSTGGSYTETHFINTSQRTSFSHHRPWPLREEEREDEDSNKNNSQKRTGFFSDHEDGQLPTPTSTSPKSHLEDEKTKEGEEPEPVYPGWKIVIPVMISMYIILFLVALVSLANDRLLAPKPIFFILKSPCDHRAYDKTRIAL